MPVTTAVRNRATLPADQYLQVEDARLRYRDEGDGPVIALLHGWTLDLEMWDPQVTALRDEFRLVRVDRRGHGLSSGVPAPERDAADLAALCRHLGITQLGLVGMSQGARGAVSLAGTAPSLVRALLLDGPPLLESAGAEDDLRLDEFRALVRAHGMAAFRREWRRHPLMQLRTQDPQVHAQLAAMIERYPGRELTEPRAPRPALAAPVLPQSVLSPALVLSGEYDLPTRVQSAARLCAQLPRAQRTVIAGAGHLPNLDCPDEYSQICRAFFRRHLRAPCAP